MFGIRWILICGLFLESRVVHGEERRGSSEAKQELDEWVYHTPDKFQVVSSSLRILPRNSHLTRMKRSEGEWRKPRQQFVTTSRIGKYLEPAPFRYYPEERAFLPPELPPRRNLQRRIIYYATLPEIVRPPVARSAPSFPQIPDNEIRVQSPLIKMAQTDKAKYYAPKITIIDAEPPYYRYPTPPSYYRYNRFPEYNPGRYEYNPVILPRRTIAVPLPPNGLTIVKRPLDVRQLDPKRSGVHVSTSSTTSTTSTTTTPKPGNNLDQKYKF